MTRRHIACAAMWPRSRLRAPGAALPPALGRHRRRRAGACRRRPRREPDLTATRAITVRASADQVWPWIAQLGQGRGGFYSYDVLENLVGCDIHSADRIVPEWQALAAGRRGQAPPEVPLVVAAVEPGRALVLRGGVPMGDTPRLPTTSPGPSCSGSSRDGTTRLLVRERYAYTQWWSPLLVEPVEAVSFVMSQKMLRGIRDRAEGRQRSWRTDLMRAMAVNGSPRKKWNTATLLESALRGCEASGAKTELVHLYSHDYQGCTSCFGCKKIGGKSYGRCAMRDELTPAAGPRDARRRPDTGIAHLLPHRDGRDAVVHGASALPEPLLHARLHLALPAEDPDRPGLHDERHRGGVARLPPGRERRRVAGHHGPHLRELRGPPLDRHLSVQGLLEVRVHALGRRRPRPNGARTSFRWTASGPTSWGRGWRRQRGSPAHAAAVGRDSGSLSASGLLRPVPPWPASPPRSGRSSPRAPTPRACP